ncbi:prephenate dehydrogenase [Nocardioides exalbidus]|uniref:Prephenate dehydrogenase n=1 Tax=Nocardioides exalbidus TaxID=402596 RepID=A0A1H4YD85_9ACTN|nr:prephenate dehydrogenase [Nocardioides exalbidus]SED15807.1 prephenate dehydrogenase [Nocardioides exalbidus]
MTDDDSLPALIGPVEVVGAGLIGTSIALVCRRLGIDVVLRDTSEENLRTAHGLGAGRAVTVADRPQLVVVAVPPAAIAEAIADALRRTDAVVTDVGSVKSAPLDAVARLVGPDDLRRYVGSHPMAGSERSGPLAASAALFDGRPWAITPHPGAAPEAVGLVEALVLECGASPRVMEPAEHDRAVARISHLPHLAAVLVAGRLASAPEEHLALSGQGVRDVTRVAASDPALWRQILEANSGAVLDLLAEVRSDLDALMVAVAADSGGDLVEILARGNAGTRAIPGKHGGPARPTRSVFVAVPDHPGELARLFGDAGEIGVNIEDVHIDHDPGRPVGLTELVVDRGSADHLLAALESRGWTTHR